MKSRKIWENINENQVINRNNNIYICCGEIKRKKKTFIDNGKQIIVITHLFTGKI